MTNHQTLTSLRWICIAAIVALPFAPFVLPLSTVALLTEFLTALTLAMAWNMLAGYANIVTVGQHALVGTGAYAFYGFAVLAGFHPAVSILLAGVTAIVLAVIMMGFVFRLRHAYFAIGTWVAAQVCLLVAGKLPGFGGGGGTSVPVSIVREFGARAADRFTISFFMALALAAVLFVTMVFLLRSRLGIGLTAVRDNEEAASAIGISVTRVRITSFLFVAPFLGIAGALIALQKVRITPEASFSLVDWTGVAMFIVVVGGIGSLEGPVLGAILYFLIRNSLSDFGSWYLIVLGACAILMMVIEPQGLWGLIRRWLGGDIVPVAQRLHRENTAFKKPAPPLASGANA